MNLLHSWIEYPNIKDVGGFVFDFRNSFIIQVSKWSTFSNVGLISRLFFSSNQDYERHPSFRFAYAVDPLSLTQAVDI